MALSNITNMEGVDVSAIYAPVTVNSVLPGPTLTKSMKEWINPEMEAAFLNILNSPRLGLPEDIANLALFLASDESKFVNGGLYVADGGMTAPLHFVQLQRDHFLPKE